MSILKPAMSKKEMNRHFLNSFFKSERRKKLLQVGGGSAGTPLEQQTYAEYLRDIKGATEIWPLVNILSGTTITAFVNTSLNGTLTGWDLQDDAGPIEGSLAPYSDDRENDVGTLPASVCSSKNRIGIMDTSRLS